MFVMQYMVSFCPKAVLEVNSLSLFFVLHHERQIYYTYLVYLGPQEALFEVLN